MSKELIYKDDARRAILKADPSLAYCIDNIKAVEAKAVVRGRYVMGIDEGDYEYGTCSVCEYNEYNAFGCCLPHNYCPNCGADMRGVEDG